MCGLLGALQLESPFTDKQEQLLKESLQTISYRGPDASSFSFFNTLSADTAQANIFLGHNRLSIIDLSESGTQPFTNDDEIFIIFNGEIYNYLELRADLKKLGHTFQTETDTEVIVNLYKEEGIKGFRKMNGMWSFMIYDQRKQQMVLSRDRFSIKPMYYYTDDTGFFVFASEVKQIIPFVKDLKPNINVLGNYLHNYIIDYNNETFFEGIKKMPQKTAMTIDLTSKEQVLEQYWDFTEEDVSKRKKEDLQEEFKSLFEDAVKVRLRSDVKVGNTLSGGLDSSSIAVTADKISTSKLTNLSVVTENKEQSEEAYVDILIKEKGLIVQKIQNDTNNPWREVEKVIWHNDEPILSLSTVAHFNMMKTFKETTDITVILSGQGGDETLAGYNKYYFYNLRQALRDKKMGRLAKEGLSMLPKFFNEFNLNTAQRYLGKSQTRKNIIDVVSTYTYEDAFHHNSVKDFRARQIMDINHFSVPALTHYEDRSSMHQSLEIRLPFLDHRLVNFNLNLPIEDKISNGFSKYMLRKAIDELPKAIAWRKDKKGFNIDEVVFFNKESVAYIKGLFENSILEQMKLIDAKKFLEEFQLFLDGKSSYWVRNVNRVIFAEIWAKTFFNN